MANSIQTKITNFNFPSTFPQLKTDPALNSGSVMLFDFSHPAGVTETAGYDAQRLNSTLSQYVDIVTPVPASNRVIAGNQDFIISLNFWANDVSSNMTLFGESANSATFLQVQPTEGTHGRLAFRMNAPTVTLILDNEPIRANEFYNLRIERRSNVITWFLNEQEYAATGNTDTNNAVDINYIGALTNDAGTITSFWDGYIWDFKVQVDTQVDTTNYSLNYAGTGDTPWTNLGTLGVGRNGTPKQGTTAAGSTTATLSRVTIGKDNRADENTIVNLASVEAAALGVTDAGVGIQPAIQPDFGLSAGRGFRLSNAFGTGSANDTQLRFNKQVSDELVSVTTAGNDYALSFWFKPELDTWDATQIGYFFRWGNNTSAGNFNHFILLKKDSSTNIEYIKFNPGSQHAWTTYKNVNSGVVNVIVTNTKAYINGSLVDTYSSPVTLQDFQSGNEHSGLFALKTLQHTSDRNIAYVYRVHFADITTSGVTEAQWVAKEYATGVAFIKAITDSIS